MGAHTRLGEAGAGCGGRRCVRARPWSWLAHVGTFATPMDAKARLRPAPGVPPRRRGPRSAGRTRGFHASSPTGLCRPESAGDPRVVRALAASLPAGDKVPAKPRFWGPSCSGRVRVAPAAPGPETRSWWRRGGSAACASREVAPKGQEQRCGPGPERPPPRTSPLRPAPSTAR